jgi:hypothetical protein
MAGFLILKSSAEIDEKYMKIYLSMLTVLKSTYCILFVSKVRIKVNSLFLDIVCKVTSISSLHIISPVVENLKGAMFLQKQDDWIKNRSGIHSVQVSLVSVH